MSNKKASQNFAQMSKTENNLWDSAILDAEKHIQGAKEKITHLKRAIESFKILRDSGEPFPLQNESQN